MKERVLKEIKVKKQRVREKVEKETNKKREKWRDRKKDILKKGCRTVTN